MSTLVEGEEGQGESKADSIEDIEKELAQMEEKKKSLQSTTYRLN